MERGSPLAKAQVSLATPKGRGAVATLWVRGANCRPILAQSFQHLGRTPAEKLQLRRPYFGRWNLSSAVEEVVIVLLSDSFFELHCHGGRVAARRITESLVAQGCEDTPIDEWPDHRSSSERQALESKLIEAKTEKVARLLLAQLNGVWDEMVQKLRDDQIAGREESLAETLNRLGRLMACGGRLTESWRVVLVGPVNAGKSSLLNAVLGYGRSIVYEQPGTTRDVVSGTTAIQGWPVEFIDTAGIRETKDEVEGEGIRRAAKQLGTADLIMEIVDLSQPHRQDRIALELPEDGSANLLRIGNKSDCITPESLPQRIQDDRLNLCVSAKEGHQISALLELVFRRLVPTEPENSDALPVTHAQLRFCQETIEAFRFGGIAAVSKCLIAAPQIGNAADRAV